MANEPDRKYSGLAELRKPAPKPEAKTAPRVEEAILIPAPARELSGAGGLSLPEKAKPVGKRRNTAFRQKAVLLKEESIAAAEKRLQEMQSGNDFSELMQALLDQWLNA